MASVSYIKLVSLLVIIGAVIATHQASSKPTCCPTFWTQFNGDCYRYLAKPEAWQEAERKCQQLGSAIDGMQGHLVSVHSEDENSFVVKYAKDLVSPPGGRGIRKTKLHKDNAIWLGFSNNKPGGQWSDATSVNYQSWQYDVRETNTCGHLWNARSKFKGTWNDAICTTKLPFVCKLNTSQPPSQSSGSGSSSGTGLLPCSYRGTPILHGDTLQLDECTICGCDNSTVKCDIKSCAPTFCDEPLRLDGECCDVCPYFVPIYELTPNNLEIVQEGVINDLNINLNIKINSDGQGVEGEGLWKLGVWASGENDGSGDRIGYQEQVLTDGQAATSLQRPPRFGGFQFNINKIAFSLDSTGATCPQMTHLCVEFAKGDAPDPVYPQVPFNVLGVAAIMEATEDPTKLISCQPFPRCEVSGSCSYRGMPILHGDTLQLDECTICGCDDSTVKCDIKSCAPTFCDEPLHFDGDCCDVCPYFVPIYEITPNNLEVVQEGVINDLNINLNIKINSDGQGVEGKGLWKLGIWASGENDGSGERIGYQEQVLTDGQAATSLQRPPLFGGFQFNINKIAFSLDSTGATCPQMTRLCVEFAKGDAPVPVYPQLPFNVVGVAAIMNATEDPTKLISCQPFPRCEGLIRQAVIY